MSYRAAWGKIKNTEEVLGVRLIEKKSGNRAGYQVTEEGIALMARFSRWFQDVERYALHRARLLLPSDPVAYQGIPPDPSTNLANDPEGKGSLP
jgi:molybdate transport system regulatory protein